VSRPEDHLTGCLRPLNDVEAEAVGVRTVDIVRIIATTLNMGVLISGRSDPQVPLRLGETHASLWRGACVILDSGCCHRLDQLSVHRIRSRVNFIVVAVVNLNAVESLFK